MCPLRCQSTSSLYSQLYSGCGSGCANMTYCPSCFTVFVFWQFAQVIYRDLQSRAKVFSDGQNGCIAHSIHQCSCAVTRSRQQPCLYQRTAVLSHELHGSRHYTDQDGAQQCRPIMQQRIIWTVIACEMCHRMTMNLAQTIQSQDKVTHCVGAPMQPPCRVW